MATDSPRKPAVRAAISWPWLMTCVIVLLAVIELRWQGRVWWCACGGAELWWTDTGSSHNSQHLFDPYAFSHVLHGILFYGLLAWIANRLAPGWRFFAAIALELAWEMIENTEFVIQRYRNATMALGYEGDSIANSLGDTLACGIGFAIARRVGLRWSVVIVASTELVMLVWIKDSLLLNVIMLIHPLEAIKQWQLGN